MREVFDISGYGLLTAAIVLALYLIPVATMLFYSSYTEYEERFADLETSLRMNFLTKTRIFYKSCKSQVVHVVNYSFCRVFGETMLILMLSGNTPRIPESILDPVRTMTATFALEAPYATDLHEQALYGITGLCLVVLVVVLMIGKLADEK
jgi:phosphate transport system permease protein